MNPPYVDGNPLSGSDPLGLTNFYQKQNQAAAQRAAASSARTPDFVNFQIDYYVGSVWGTFSRSGNSFVGCGLNKTYPNPASVNVSITAGWLNASNPTLQRIDDFIDGYDGGGAAGYAGVGGGIAFSTNGSAMGVRHDIM